VVVELMARFDEEVNMNWAARLEEVGAHVVYGVVGHKTHAKMSLIVRREDSGDGKMRLRRYAHLATGNYHPRTARLYTDFGLLTANEEICADVAEIFKQLTGLGRVGKMKHVWQSPFTLHKRIVAAIRNEAAHAAAGKPARIIAKMNALLEPQIIEELYAASAAGREDRAPGARRVRAQARGRGPFGEHPRALDHRPLPRALAHFLLPRRGRRERVPRERRLDGPQLLPPHRAVLPGARRGAQAARDPRRPAGPTSTTTARPG
jgi:polyphosphate kinase